MARTAVTADAASTAIAVQALNGSALIIGGKTFKTAKWVTRTVLRQEMDVPFYVKFDGPIHSSTMDPENSKYKDPKTGDGVVPDIAHVMNLETGEFQTLIVNAVLGSELRQNYADDGYVGKLFGIVQTKSDLDKRYKTYKIIELEMDEAAPGGASATKHIDGESAEAVERAKGRNK